MNSSKAVRSGLFFAAVLIGVVSFDYIQAAAEFEPVA